MKVKTKCIKLQTPDSNLYGFKVPLGTSLDPMDIIKNGELVMLRFGIQSQIDPKGRILGKSGGAWNTIKPMPIDGTSIQLQAIADAKQKAISKMNYAEEHPDAKLLPQLSVLKHRGKNILRDDSVPCYFIYACTPCANCGEPISGRQILTINKHGRVAEESPFQPDDPKVVPANHGSKKLLHPECAAKSIFPENLTFKDIVKKATEAGVKMDTDSDKKTVEVCLLEILSDHDRYSADFARGASYMFHLIKTVEKED